MKKMAKYLNMTAVVLSNNTTAPQERESRVIRVRFDAPNAPSETVLKVDSRTYFSRSFVENDRIRVFSALKSENGCNAPLPAIIADESFPDIFRGDPELLDNFRNCDRSLQEAIIERNLGEHFPNSSVNRVRINDFARAKTFYSLSKTTFTPNQQSYIEQWLDNYRHADNARKLEYVLSITPSASEENHTIQIEEMRTALNARFSGMERQKEEIIRHLASSMFANHTGTVICLVGPAGTGKTALIRALGEILHKPYAFLPCSGMTTSLDVLGERPVYGSASVGRLVDAFYKVGTTDCLIHLDEFDKMPGLGTASQSKDGNPYNAFLQVFSEKEVTDTFIGTEILCPNTMFVCTCNSLDNIPVFIQNRFDSVISIPGYTDDQLLEIVFNHIIPKMNAKYNVPESNIVFDEKAVREVLRFIDDFGARRTEKHIELLYKSLISSWVERETVEKTHVTEEMVRTVLRANVDMNNIRVHFRQHMKDYSPEVVKKVISLEEELDRPHEHSSEQQKCQRQLEYLVKLHPDKTPFVFDADVFYEEANKSLYGMETEKHLLASVFHELAVKSSEANKRLLLIGPPGVGKSALIHAAAIATGLNYVRVGLNGASQPEYITGFEKTWASADAGIVVREVAKAATLRSLIHLDELDKVSNAETQAALISLLDDSGLFADHFLDGIPIDFSSAIFIATANDYKLSPALLSRFTTIEVGTYSRSEQEKILSEYVLPKACEGYDFRVVVSDEAKKAFMSYAQAGGVRELKEKAVRVIRETVFAKREYEEICIQAEDVYQVLGPCPMVRGNRPETGSLPGLSNGLAVTGSGAGMCFAIESRLLPGSGVEITGLPSEVITDSVKLAMGVLSADYGVDFSNKKLHIHFAEGAVKKDGPSAGTSILMSIYSASIGQPIPTSACYTGEIDLFGYVWAVGGIVEKVEAADIAGIKNAYIPRQSFEKLSDTDRRKLSLMNINVIPVKHINEIIDDVYGRNKRCVSVG